IRGQSWKTAIIKKKLKNFSIICLQTKHKIFWKNMVLTSNTFSQGGVFIMDMNFSPLWLSFKTAIIATLIVFIIGVWLARIIGRNQFFGKSVVEAIIMLPLVLPPTVVGFGLLYIFGKNGPIGMLLMRLFDFQVVFTW